MSPILYQCFLSYFPFLIPFLIPVSRFTTLFLPRLSLLGPGCYFPLLLFCFLFILLSCCPAPAFFCCFSSACLFSNALSCLACLRASLAFLVFSKRLQEGKDKDEDKDDDEYKDNHEEIKVVRKGVIRK